MGGYLQFAALNKLLRKILMSFGLTVVQHWQALKPPFSQPACLLSHCLLGPLFCFPPHKEKFLLPSPSQTTKVGTALLSTSLRFHL